MIFVILLDNITHRQLVPVVYLKSNNNDADGSGVVPSGVNHKTKSLRFWLSAVIIVVIFYLTIKSSNKHQNLLIALVTLFK